MCARWCGLVYRYGWTLSLSLSLAFSQLLVSLDPQARRGRGGRATEKGVGEQWSSHVTACRLGLVDLLGLCCFFGGCGWAVVVVFSPSLPGRRIPQIEFLFCQRFWDSARNQQARGLLDCWRLTCLDLTSGLGCIAHYSGNSGQVVTLTHSEPISGFGLLRELDDPAKSNSTKRP